MLPDDVLLDIFDFYRLDSPFFPWMWVTLAHVSPRWRQVVLASPRRLDLHFLCRPQTHVRELLNFLPLTMPIMISNSFDSPTSTTLYPSHALSIEDGGQVIAAIEQRDRVWWIHLQELPSAFLEKLAIMMQETFPTIRFVRLWAADENQPVPVLPEGFLGGSAPVLESLFLRGIPFPEPSKLLQSTNDLVHLVLQRVPDSGYISPEAMITALSTCSKLEMLVIGFLSENLRLDSDGPDSTSQQINSITRLSLPVLTNFEFDGSGSYFDNFVPRIEGPLLARDNNPFWQHETSEIRIVHYEASFTQTGFSSRYISRPLIIPDLEDE